MLAFDSPPYVGNAIALVVYFAVFLVIQIGLGLRYLQRWNWPIFLGVLVFLVLEILGSVAYIKLHYAPVTGAWYSLWIFTLTAAPTFFISSLHFCVQRVLQDTDSVAVVHRSLRSSCRAYITTCLGVDFLSLIFTIIGAAYAGAKSSSSPASSKPGFDLMVAAMAVQACSLVALLIAGFEVTISYMRHRRGEASRTQSTDVNPAHVTKERAPAQRNIKFPRVFLAFLASLLINGILLLARTVVRAVDVVGGLEGQLRDRVLVNVESVLLFIAILLMTALHPAVVLRKTVD